MYNILYIYIYIYIYIQNIREPHDSLFFCLRQRTRSLSTPSHPSPVARAGADHYIYIYIYIYTHIRGLLTGRLQCGVELAPPRLQILRGLRQITNILL